MFWKAYVGFNIGMEYIFVEQKYASIVCVVCPHLDDMSWKRMRPIFENKLPIRLTPTLKEVCTMQCKSANSWCISCSNFQNRKFISYQQVSWRTCWRSCIWHMTAMPPNPRLCVSLSNKIESYITKLRKIYHVQSIELSLFQPSLKEIMYMTQNPKIKVHVVFFKNMALQCPLFLASDLGFTANSCVVFSTFGIDNALLSLLSWISFVELV